MSAAETPRHPRRGCCQALSVAIAVLLSAQFAGAQVIDGGFSVTNGTVYATALAGNTLYIGGDFTQVGPVTGAGVPIDASTGVPTPFPKVAGSVYDVASDGAGGWFIGGRFSHVGGVPRSNLAHIQADGSLSAWAPVVNDAVMAIAVSGGTVYAGGWFSTLGGQTRIAIGAVSAATGMVTAWNPGTEGPVFGLAVGGSMVYVGGRFSTIGGATRRNVAALDAATGLATAWNPVVHGPGEPNVHALAVAAGVVYVGGGFDSIGTEARKSIGAIDAATGLPTAWSPGAGGGVYAIAVSGGTVYAGGNFSSIGGAARNNIAALDAATGLATGWDPDANEDVSALVVSGSTVYVGGYFNHVGGRARSLIAALDASTGTATSWDPNGSGPQYIAAVYALAMGNGKVYAAGTFTSMGRQSARNRLAAIDVDTGLPTAWNPGANGTVHSIEVSGGMVFAGGEFTFIGSQSRSRIAAIDATTGTVTAWNPGANGQVRCLLSTGGVLYAGGNFTRVGGQPRNNLAAIDVATGNTSSWNPDVTIPHTGVRAIAASGNTVYVGGYISSIGGLTRYNIGAIDATTGLPTDWNPDAISGVNALQVSGDKVYAGGSFYIIGGEFRSRIAALDIDTGQATAWDPNVGGSSYPAVHDLAVSGGEVYVVGAFGSVGGANRSCVASIDATTGIAANWDPDASDVALAVAVGGGRVYVGGQFTSMGGQPSGGLAAIEDSPTPVLLARFEAEALDGTIRLVWQFGQPDRVAGISLERSESARGPWVTIPLDGRAAARAGEFVDHTILPARTYLYRLTVDLADGSKAIFGPITATSVPTVEHSGLTSIAPNPATSRARIDYTLAREERVEISLLDASGRRAELLLDQSMSPGKYSLVWDRRGARERLPAGVYFVRWKTQHGTMQRKLVLMP